MFILVSLISLSACGTLRRVSPDCGVTFLFSIEKGRPNDADCYKNILFQFHSQNQEPDGDFHGVSVADMKTGSTLQFLHLGFDPNFHNSSITVLEDKQGDPLIYASENYAPNKFYNIIVYSLKNEAGAFAIVPIRTIRMPDPERLGIHYPHAVPTKDGKHIWIEGYSTDHKESVFLLFDMPAANDTVVHMAGPLSEFRLPKKEVTDQAYCVRGDLIYQVVGVKGNSWLRIINNRKGRLVQDVFLPELGLDAEPEAVFFWKNKLCLSFSDKDTKIYTIDL